MEIARQTTVQRKASDHIDTWGETYTIAEISHLGEKITLIWMEEENDVFLSNLSFEEAKHYYSYNIIHE